MNYRELLEMAAKAAGIKLVWPIYKPGANEIPMLEDSMKNTVATWWNPIADDGDALRLAVKLKMNIEIDGVCAVATAFGPEYVHSANIKFRDDMKPDYAVRRAIVRAAAEIGKSMP